jgi:fatty-acyl-CoA synthase
MIESPARRDLEFSMTEALATSTPTERPTRFRSHVELILARALADPERVMISDAGRAVSGAQFARGVGNAATALLARGINRRRVVALAAPICLEAVLVRYAAGLLGCATVVCPNADDPARLREFLASVGADELVCFAGTADIAARTRATGSARRVHVIDDVDLDTESESDEFVLALAGAPLVDPSRPAVFVTSGGTTGASKASRRTFAQWCAAIDVPADPERRQLICTPLAYIAQILLDQTLVSGGTVVLRDQFDAAEVLAAIERERITNVCLVEPRLVELADHPDAARRDLSSLVAISHIGADAAPSLRRRLVTRLGDRLAHPYGASEAGLVSLVDPSEYRSDADGPGSSGRILPGVEVRIERATDGPASDTRSGRVVVRSRGVADGYAGAVRPAAFRGGGWYDTGDCGYLDDQARLHVKGRAKDERMIHGVGVFPVDVQDDLCARVDVAYAVALPSQGTAGFDAVVVLRSGATATAADLTAATPASLGLQRLVVTTTIPVTEQGKPDRAALRHLLGA